MAKRFALVVLSVLFLSGLMFVSGQNLPDKQQPKADNQQPKNNTEKPKKLSKEELQKKAEELIKQLGSDKYEVREQATKELIKLGKDVLPFVEKALKKTTDPEVKMRLGQVKEKLSAPPKEDKLTRPAMPFKFKLGIQGPGSVIQVTDATGVYTLKTLKGGKVEVTAAPTNGKKETRTFDSRAEFEKKWPEVAKKFKGMHSTFKLKILPRPPMPPMPKPFAQPKDLDKLFKELEKQFKELEKKLNDGKFDELEKRLKEFEKQHNQDNQDNQDEDSEQFYQGTRSVDGNQYKVTVKNGKVIAELTDKDGKITVKKFDSVEELFKQWPEFAKQFPELKREVRTPKNLPDDSHKTLPAPTTPEHTNSALGATFGPASDVLKAQLQLKDGEGLVIKQIADTESFCKHAGLKLYDIILAVNGKTITSVSALKAAINSVEKGKEIEIQIIRQGQRMTLKTTK